MQIQRYNLDNTVIIGDGIDGLIAVLATIWVGKAVQKAKNEEAGE